MSESYEEQDDDHWIVCPYCQHEHNGSDYHGDYDDDIFVCEECDRYFRLTTEISVSYHSRADCELIGKEHQWSKVIDHPGKEYCTRCHMVQILSPMQEKGDG